MILYFYLFLKITASFFIIVIVYRLARWSFSIGNKREEDLAYQAPAIDEIDQAVKKYGRSTIMIVHLYQRLRYFVVSGPNQRKSDFGLIGYVSKAEQNIMIAEPLCQEALTKDSILEFAQFTQSQQKDCVLFPINQETASIAHEIGFSLVKVGNEPVFDLRVYNVDAIDAKVRSSIRQTVKNNIKIESISGSEISNSPFTPELNLIVDEWLLSRHGSRMQLINEVSPFSAVENKKYFIARSEFRLEAFLACSPIYARNGYFIHDLIRRPDAMNGVSEALVVEALKTFKNEGYHFASLGVAPLSGLDVEGSNLDRPVLNWFLNRIYQKHKTFMRFKTLYQFKKKFKPTSEEPSYVAVFPPQLKLNHILALISMFSPSGMIGDIFFKWGRWKEGNQLPRPILNLLSSNVVTLPRMYPFTFPEFASRIPFTLSMVGLNIFTYFNKVSWFGKVTPEALREYGFSYSQLLSQKWFILISANFLHFDFLHLMGNMCMLLVFCGTLEFIGGHMLVILAYLISMQADVPSGVFLLSYLHKFQPAEVEEVMNYIDVGASLGILGCLGALMHFLKNSRILLVVTCLITIVIALNQENLFGIDHTFACLIGYFIGWFYLHRIQSTRAFQKLRNPGASLSSRKFLELIPSYDPQSPPTQ